MGFSIHVAGSGGFRHARSNVPYGDEWELSWIETQLLARVGVSARPSLTGNSVRHAMAAMSRITQVRLLVSTIEFLMVNHGDGSLNVAVRHSHTLWPTTGGYRSISISGDSAAPVAGDLCRFLDAMDMNKWGPVIEILDSLNRFNTAYEGRSGYMVNMTFYD